MAGRSSGGYTRVSYPAHATLSGELTMTEVNSHDVAARMFQSIRDAQDGKTLDAILSLGLNYWVSGVLDLGTIEAATYRAMARARELPADAREYPSIQPDIPPETFVEPEVVEDFDRQRAEFKKRKLRHNAGMGRKGIIR
jgi:hypothetical protein